MEWRSVIVLRPGAPNMKRLEFFEKDPIKWTKTYQVADFYKTLLDLKSSNPALRGGDPNVTTYLLNTTANDKILAYVRKNGKGEVLVVLNMSKEPVSFNIDDGTCRELSGMFSKKQKETLMKVRISISKFQSMPYLKNKTSIRIY